MHSDACNINLQFSDLLPKIVIYLCRKKRYLHHPEGFSRGRTLLGQMEYANRSRTISRAGYSGKLTALSFRVV